MDDFTAVMDDATARSSAYIARGKALDDAEADQARLIGKGAMVIWLVFLAGLAVLWFWSDMSTRKLVAWVMITLAFRYIAFRVWVNRWSERRLAKIDVECPAPPPPVVLSSPTPGHEDQAGHG